MEALEEANMSTYPRYGVPFSAYFQSFDKVVFRQIDKGKLVAFAIADAAHPHFSRVVMHELHVDAHHRRCKHATTLVVAIDSGLPAGGWIEAHVQHDNATALAFYRALNFQPHSQSAGMAVLRRLKSSSPQQTLVSPEALATPRAAARLVVAQGSPAPSADAVMTPREEAIECEVVAQLLEAEGEEGISYTCP